MADDNLSLQLRISEIAGRINRKKQQDTAQHHQNSHAYGGGGASYYHPYHSPRRGRGGAVHRPHQNRTLVLNSTSASHDTAPPSPPTAIALASTPMESPGDTSWISKRDRHTMQLINPAVLDRVTQDKVKISEDSRQQREQQPAPLREVAIEHRHPPKPERVHQITIDDITFNVTDGGSKLVPVQCEPKAPPVHLQSDAADPTESVFTMPEEVKVSGVTFIRSVDGPYLREGLVQNPHHQSRHKLREPCPRFTTTGMCSKGPRCKFVHDPNKVAICKDFLKGSCPLGDSCDLSHDATLNRLPHCIHFLRGNCTNESCRYAHTRVNPGAPVCRPFATLGYCENGSACADRHINECPDYASTGFCPNQKCRLQHVDRAGQLRSKAPAAVEASPTSSGSPISRSSNEPSTPNYDGVDSETTMDEDFMGGVINAMEGHDAMGHELSQQQDFVRF